MPMGRRKPLALAAVAVAVMCAPAASAQVLEHGRRLTEQLFKGEISALLPKLSADFVKAAGGPQGLAAMAAQLKQQAGTETRVVSEHAFREGGFTSYYRVSEFAKGPEPYDAVGLGRGRKGHRRQHQSHPRAGRSPSTRRPPVRSGVAVGPPGRGLWYVAWGGPDPVHNYHVSDPVQRFAYDFVVMRDGNFRQGEGRANEDHFCFGAPVVAPADGRVVAAADGIPDNSRPGVRDSPRGARQPRHHRPWRREAFARGALPAEFGRCSTGPDREGGRSPGGLRQ
jgi:hypothetical protein